MMTKLPKIAEIDASSSGWGFFLCARKDVRTGRSGEYLTLVLQDVSGEIRAKVFQDVDALKEEFSAGEFVKVQGRGNSFNQQVELVLDKIRRVMPDRDAADGFREDECVLCAPRPAAEMWQELLSRIEQVSEPSLHRLLGTIVQSNKDRLINWPAALNVHHAYRSGLLEHILKILETSIFLSNAYIAKTRVFPKNLP